MFRGAEDLPRAQKILKRWEMTGILDWVSKINIAH